MEKAIFEWDESKNIGNQREHRVSFEKAQHAFLDKLRVVAHDEKHRAEEERWFCVGKVEGRTLTVRFTYRNGMIGIIEAGFWRKWSKFYEQENRSEAQTDRQTHTRKRFFAATLAACAS